MRWSSPLLIATVLAAFPIARGQTAATRAAVGQTAAAASLATPVRQRKGAHPPRRSPTRPASRPPVHPAPGAAPSAGADGVLALGATDITGNKELPKVMAIVPWKSSPGAGGVIKPSDSLLDEVLQPVDRGVFQRRIRYYGQLQAPRQTTPVGDSVSSSGNRPR